jgi:hypothetical protein
LGDETEVDYMSATQKSLRSIEGNPPEDAAKYAKVSYICIADIEVYGVAMMAMLSVASEGAPPGAV